MQGSVSIEGDLDQATDPSPLHQTPPSTVAFTKSPTIGYALSSDQPMPRQSQMEGYAREIVEQVYYIDVTKCLLAIPANPCQSFASTPILLNRKPSSKKHVTLHPSSIIANQMTICQSNNNWPIQGQLDTILRSF